VNERQVVAAGVRAPALHGAGEVRVAASPEAVWQALLDADTLASIIPGCHDLEQVSATHFRAEVTLGVGPARGRYRADVGLTDLLPPRSATLTGRAVGGLGSAAGTGHVTLKSDGRGGTILAFNYTGEIAGKAAAIAGRLLDGAARIVIHQFFAALARRVGAAPAPVWRGWLVWLSGGLGRRS